MSFTYPLGLLGLIGIPILILLYIIKSHYSEQIVASVYLWQLSEKFLKKKKRVRFSGLLSLIVQILAVAAISLTVAHPVIVLPDAANDYCFVLDASGSMRAQNADTTRFEAGKAQIREIIENSKDGSSYSLICAGSTTMEAFRSVNDRKAALAMLDALECEWGRDTCTDALAVAQAYYTAEHSPLTYLVTDKAYETEDIELISVARSEENYAFVSYTYQKGASNITFSGQVISYDRDAEITVELYINGEKRDETTVSAEKLVAADFTFTADIVDFDDVRLQITNSDDLMDDNVGVLYTLGQTQQNKSLIISDTPAYLEFIFSASGKTSVDVVSTKQYSTDPEKYTGYGLYVFDACAPDRVPQELPKNATVWFFNLQKSIDATGFSFSETVEAEGTITAPGAEEGESTQIQNRFEPTYSTSSAAFVKKMTDNLLKEQISVKKYARYVPTRNFTNLMYQGNDSLIFLGENKDGNRQVVFAFDLHDTDFALKADFALLVNNLLDYSFPAVIEQSLFDVGEEVLVNVPSGCTDLLLKAPSGKIYHPEFSSTYTYCTLDQMGTYCIVACMNEVEQEYYVYSRMPASESEVFSDQMLAMEKQSDVSVTDGFYDKLVIYFIILALAFLVDWGVYCYEQYQLR